MNDQPYTPREKAVDTLDRYDDALDRASAAWDHANALENNWDTQHEWTAAVILAESADEQAADHAHTLAAALRGVLSEPTYRQIAECSCGHMIVRQPGTSSWSHVDLFVRYGPDHLIQPASASPTHALPSQSDHA